MVRINPLCLAAAIIAASSPSVMAQPTAQTTQMSYFKMFLWTDDVFGLLNIWVIVLLSAVSLAIAIALALKYRKSMVIPNDTQQQVELLLAEKRYREAIEFAAGEPSYLGKVVSSGLNEASNGFGAMERAMEETSDAETTRMLRPIEFLNLIGNISPMLGLFGTVYGMIIAFYQLVESGGKPDPGQLAAGISTALVTTFWGLIVAIPSLTAYALIRNRVDELTTEGLIIAEDLIQPFKPSAKRAAQPAPGAPGAAPTKPPRAVPKPTEAA